MATQIIMPSGGQTTNEMMVIEWHKKVGDPVRRGDTLFSIETDKATMDVESHAEGILLEIYHGADETVSAGEPMALVGEAGEAAHGETGPAPAAPADAEPEPAPAARPPEPAAEGAPESAAGPLTASPAARKAAAEAGIALPRVAGETGRLPVKRADVTLALERLRVGGGADGEADADVAEASAMRRAIARRMMESAAGAPQYFVSVDVDMENAMALRARLNDRLGAGGVKAGYHDILMKCACAAIARHPLVNASYDDGRITTHRHVHFGLAVGLPGGLVVPVVRNADRKGIAALAAENARNIGKAREGRLRPDDLSGGTITLSNLGMYGVSSFTAILNRPEACILAAGGILEKPVVRGGAVVAGRVMNLTATFDHRLIDGAAGAAFLQDLKRLLEDPALLLL